MPPGTSQSLSSTEPVPRNGLSLAHNGCSLSEASIPGSTVLTCYFATSRLVPPPGPPSAPLPSLVCPSRKQLLRFRPVAALLAGSLGCFLCLHSPPGLLPPSGSKRSTDSAALRLTFRTRPIASRSPPPVLFLGLAADHRSAGSAPPPRATEDPTQAERKERLLLSLRP
jgi:hypothetical protein